MRTRVHEFVCVPLVIVLSLAIVLLGGGVGVGVVSAANRPSGVPPAGASPTIDKILARGSLKVGVNAVSPWLLQSGDRWSGPAWTLAEAFANRLRVRLEPVIVSQETKITAVRTGLIDILVNPVADTLERRKAVDFVIYDQDGFCWAALRSNNKVNTLDDLNSPNVTLAVIAGGADSQLVPPKYPKARVIQVVALPNQEDVLDVVLAGRADATTIEMSRVYKAQRAYPQLKFIPGPRISDCLAHPDFPINIGMAIRKGDSVFFNFLESIRKPLQPKLLKEKEDIVSKTK